MNEILNGQKLCLNWNRFLDYGDFFKQAERIPWKTMTIKEKDRASLVFQTPHHPLPCIFTTETAGFDFDCCRVSQKCYWPSQVVWGSWGCLFPLPLLFAISDYTQPRGPSFAHRVLLVSSWKLKPHGSCWGMKCEQGLPLYSSSLTADWSSNFEVSERKHENVEKENLEELVEVVGQWPSGRRAFLSKGQMSRISSISE